MYGRRCDHCTGLETDRTGYYGIFLYWRFYILCFWHDRSGQCGIQPDGYYFGGTGQFHYGHDRSSASSGHGHDHDGRCGRKSQHRKDQKAAALPGVKAIIFKSPCIALVKPDGACTIDRETCINCKKCIRELGCPAIVVRNGQVEIESSMCTGCGLCSQVCPVGAIKGDRHE